MNYPRMLCTGLSLSVLTSTASAQLIDLAFSPTQSIVQVGDSVDIRIVATADAITGIDYAAIDALLDYDLTYLALLGVDDTDASENWFVSSFLPDPDGINDDLTDGNAIYTALASTSDPATALPAGSIVTTLKFVAILETPGTTLSFLPTMGLWGGTDVYDFHVAGGILTGDFSDTASIRIVSEPTSYCFGTEALCPCDNDAGPAEGCLNSTGAGAVIDSIGSTSTTSDDLVLVATQVPAFQFGVFVVGGGTNNIPFGDGLRCVAPGPTGLNRF
ncbi:MAG: hypothetical protein ACI841_002369, partial [Planctomycetota bacterium]